MCIFKHGLLGINARAMVPDPWIFSSRLQTSRKTTERSRSCSQPFFWVKDQRKCISQGIPRKQLAQTDSRRVLKRNYLQKCGQRMGKPQTASGVPQGSEHWAPHCHTILRNRGLCGKDLLIVTEISHLGDPKESALRESTSKHRPQTNKTLHYHLPPLHYSGAFSTGTWASWFQSLHHSCSDTRVTTVLISISSTLWQQAKSQIISLSISWGSLICRIPKESAQPGVYSREIDKWSAGFWVP